MRYDFFLRVSVKNRNPYFKTSAGRCCAGAFKSGVKRLMEERELEDRRQNTQIEKDVEVSMLVCDQQWEK
jgi:DNA-binding IclR family transcriptional regulator